MSKITLAIGDQVRTTTESLSLYSFKIFSGLLLSLTVALIFQEIIGFETISFVLISCSMLLGFLKLVKHWKLGSLLVFDLICVLSALLLRMYILIAPGA